MSTPYLTTLLGFRQAQIMQLLWTHGAATARELHTWLTCEERIAYMTVQTTCVRLVEKGLLERRRVMAADAPTRAKQAYVYTPRLSEAELLQRAHDEPMAPPLAHTPHQLRNGSERETIESLLAYLGTLQDADGHAVDDRALDTITALLERAEAAEQAVLIYQAEALRALHRAASAERRAVLAEGLSVQPTPQRGRARPVPSAAVYEYSGDHKICRVCGRPAPPPAGKRRDGLRVCSLESCRTEARRRDNVAKQRRSNAQRRVAADEKA